jgi:hypothetical protein
MLSSLNGFDGLLGVHGRGGCNDNSLQGLLLGQHVVEGEVCAAAELLLCGV